VESKGEQSILALELIVGDGKVGLGDCKAVAKVETTVHVGVREGGHILRFSSICRGVMLKDLLFLPSLLNSLLNVAQVITLVKALSLIL